VPSDLHAELDPGSAVEAGIAVVDAQRERSQRVTEAQAHAGSSGGGCVLLAGVERRSVGHVGARQRHAAGPGPDGARHRRLGARRRGGEEQRGDGGGSSPRQRSTPTLAAPDQSTPLARSSG
jgi:hypothetical protein